MNDDPASSPVEPPSTTSLAAKLVNVFTEPGDVFDEIRRTPPRAANWAVPLFILCLTCLVSVVVVLSRPAAQQQLKEIRTREVQRMVDQGKLQQEQANRVLENPALGWLALVGGTIGGVVSMAIGVAWMAFVMWGIGRWLMDAAFPFGKAFEAAALAGMVLALGNIVTMLLGIATGDLYARPALSLVLSGFDVHNSLHLLLASVNVFYLWAFALLGVALARFSGSSFGHAGGWMGIYFVVSRAVLILSGLGQIVM